MEMEEIDAISELYPLSSLRFGEIGCILSNQDKNSVHLRGKYHITALGPFSMSPQTAGDRVPIKRRKEEEKGERRKE